MTPKTRGVEALVLAIAMAVASVAGAKPPPSDAAAPGTGVPQDQGKSPSRVRSKGAIVVALNEAARPAAKALARLVYQDKDLRPSMDEAMAHVLTGGEPQREELNEAALAVKALSEADDSVRRRLLTSLGRDLRVDLVVLVSADERTPEPTPSTPSARALRVSTGRFASVTLAAEAAPTRGDGAAHWEWGDAVSVLRGIARRPPAQRAASGKAKRTKKTPAPAPRASPVSNGHGADGTDDANLLTSPWFWGGLGAVVTVGVTVLVLSQTVFKDSDSVSLQGRVSP